MWKEGYRKEDIEKNTEWNQYMMQRMASEGHFVNDEARERSIL